MRPVRFKTEPKLEKTNRRFWKTEQFSVLQKMIYFIVSKNRPLMFDFFSFLVLYFVWYEQKPVFNIFYSLFLTKKNIIFYFENRNHGFGLEKPKKTKRLQNFHTVASLIHIIYIYFYSVGIIWICAVLIIVTLFLVYFYSIASLWIVRLLQL